MPMPENYFLQQEELVASQGSPPDFYARIFPELQEGKPWAYVIESLTSSGFRKALKGPIKNPKQLETIVQANARLAEDIGAQYFKDMPYTLIYPHWVGRRRHEGGSLWKEFDYLSHFYFLLAGMEPQDARELYTQAHNGLGDAIEVMNNHAIDREQRRSAYEYMAQEFLSAYVPQLSGQHPIQVAFAMPGSHDSLGCGFERTIVRGFGLPLTEIPPPTSFDTHALRHAYRVGAFGH